MKRAGRTHKGGRNKTGSRLGKSKGYRKNAKEAGENTEVPITRGHMEGASNTTTNEEMRDAKTSSGCAGPPDQKPDSYSSQMPSYAGEVSRPRLIGLASRAAGTRSLESSPPSATIVAVENTEREKNASQP